MERFDILDEKGVATGETRSRSEVHQKGDWHRTVHVWLLHGEELLLQLRGPHQESNPNLWDISCAGHLSAGENPEQGVEREFKEELGLELSQQNPEFLGELRSIWSSGTFLDREFNAVYLVNWKGERPEVVFQREEIEAVKWISWQELRAQVNSEDPSLVSHPEEFDLLFRRLEGLKTCDNLSSL